MSDRNRKVVTGAANIAAAFLIIGAAACGEASVQSGDVESVETEAPVVNPLNDYSNPYQTVDGWATLPDGRTWGSTAGVDIDPDGQHIWAIDRCGANSCAGSDLDPIVKFDPEGNVVTTFGGGTMLFPHGLHVDQDGNVWVTDARGPDPDDPSQAGKGHVAIKFSAEGEVLLTLGEPGVAGTGEGAILNTPNDVAVGPNGDIYVGDGHEGQNSEDPTTVARIVKFSADGEFITSWGQYGSEAGDLRTPHALAFSPEGQLVVADRGNNRLQIFDEEGNYIDEFKQFSRPSDFAFDANGLIYVADSESAFDNIRNPGAQPGIRIGSLADGTVNYLIVGEVEAYPDGSNPEGVAVDAAGNVYGAVVSGGGAMLKSVM